MTLMEKAYRRQPWLSSPQSMNYAHTPSQTQGLMPARRKYES